MYDNFIDFDNNHSKKFKLNLSYYCGAMCVKAKVQNN